MCREEFQLSGTFDSYGRLFKALLSYLENCGRSRALRMQALYLFVRGLYVASVALTLLYFSAIVSIEYGLLPDDVLNALRSADILSVSTIVSAGLVYITDRNREELEEDWIQYTVTECYMEMIE